MGLMLLEQEECPNCGVAVRDMMQYETVNVHCPICKHDYFRVRHIPSTLKE
jgi:Zn finger protein HypA/HybF involved in hydrogenase expression